MSIRVTVLDLSLAKQEDGFRLGADDYRCTTDPSVFKDLASSFDLILSTVPEKVDLDTHIGLLALDGAFVNISSSQQKPLSLSSVNLLTNRRSLAGTRSGGIAETQEMIDFCAEHGVMAQVEMIGADAIDEAYRRVLAGDVRFRFVIDVSTMRDTKAAPPIAELKASLA
jgi:uncharacterized zinc-type alcohol dehydrogenase-like protein